MSWQLVLVLVLVLPQLCGGVGGTAGGAGGTGGDLAVAQKLAQEVADEVDTRWTPFDEGELFCPPSVDENTCTSYVEELNSMLTTVSAIGASSVRALAGPVATVVTVHGLQNAPRTLPQLSDAEMNSAVIAAAREDASLARVARRSLRALKTVEPEERDSVSAALKRVKQLRYLLASLVEDAYQSLYLGDTFPAERLRPVVRAVGSIFQRALFNWHCHTIEGGGVFFTGLLPSERAYVETFFELYGYEHFNFRFGFWYGNRMSSFTWSHRHSSKAVGRVNSLRFACGTTSQEAPLAEAALAVLTERGITMDSAFEQNPDAFSFYGLGWDHGKSYFKVYIMFHGVENLPERYASMARSELAKAGVTSPLQDLSLGKHGLLSLTYVSDGECSAGSGQGTCAAQQRLQEEKIYLYPTSLDVPAPAADAATAALPSTKPPGHVGSVAWLLASERGFIPQYDVHLDAKSLQSWRQKLGAVGTSLLERYTEIRLRLETVAHTGDDDWVLYFPAGSG